MDYEGIASDQILDREINHLYNLEDLDLIGQKITYIPETWGSLPKLKHLNIEANAKIPESISKLSNLEGLAVHASEPNNKDVLSLIEKINGLKVLGYADGRSIEKIPPFPKSLHNLEGLNLLMANCYEVPESVEMMSNLQSLYLGLELKKIPTWLTKLSNLEHITFDVLPDNRLPLFLKELPNLKHINLQSCFLDDNEKAQILQDFEGYDVIVNGM